MLPKYYIWEYMQLKVFYLGPEEKGMNIKGSIFFQFSGENLDGSNF